jgi:hypothetical protein
MTTSWRTTLDAFECHLDTQTQLVDQGRYDEVVAFAPLEDLPGLPKALVARASELLARAQALLERGIGLRDDTMRLLAAPRRLPFHQPPVSAYVDQQA